jgi:hypothetical protein
MIDERYPAAAAEAAVFLTLESMVMSFPTMDTICGGGVI